MTRSCDAFLEDPELHTSHLEECESCRRLEAGLSVAPEVKPRLHVAKLPVAPWEGATHRSWPVVVSIVALVIATAALLFWVVGVAPWEGFAATLRSLSPRVDAIGVTASISELLRNAPMQFHVFVLIAFVLINILFVALLRRPTKGYDLTLR